jgi:hypothetical protein
MGRDSAMIRLKEDRAMHPHQARIGIKNAAATMSFLAALAMFASLAAALLTDFQAAQAQGSARAQRAPQQAARQVKRDCDGQGPRTGCRPQKNEGRQEARADRGRPPAFDIPPSAWH